MNQKQKFDLPIILFMLVCEIFLYSLVLPIFFFGISLFGRLLSSKSEIGGAYDWFMDFSWSIKIPVCIAVGIGIKIWRSIYLKGKHYKGAKEEKIDFYIRGNTYMASGEYQQAIDDFTKTIELHPQNINTYHLRGLAYVRLEKYQQAIDDFTKTIELNSKEANAYYWRGFAYEKLGKYQQAIDDYYQSGILYLKQKDKTMISKCIESIKIIEPSSLLIDKLQNLIDQI
jgi:tetratricopeptide (TPR) repeat protein